VSIKIKPKGNGRSHPAFPVLARRTKARKTLPSWRLSAIFPPRSARRSLPRAVLKLPVALIYSERECQRNALGWFPAFQMQTAPYRRTGKSTLSCPPDVRFKRWWVPCARKHLVVPWSGNSQG